MKILYFHQHFSTPVGATGTRSYEFSQYLKSKGHDVTIVCGQYQMAESGLKNEFVNGRRSGIVDGLNVVEYELPYSNHDSFLKRTKIFLQYSFKSLKEVFTQEYDLLFATSTPLTAAIPGIVMKLFKKKAFVFEVRDLWPELPREMGVITNPIVLKLMDWLEFLAYRFADRTIGLSPGICRGIISRGVESTKVHLIPNGCDLKMFDSQLLCKSIFCHPSIQKDDFVAIFTGAHGIANGLNAALDAALILKERGNTKIKLVFVGEGREKPSLKERAKIQKLSNCIFFDSISKTKLTQMLQASDVGLMLLKNISAFYYGTSPNKFFDYLASGRPVLTNYPGWVAKLLTEHKCGVAVSPEDPNKFADALENLAADQDLRREMGRNSLKLATEKFSRVDLARQFENVLVKTQAVFN